MPVEDKHRQGYGPLVYGLLGISYIADDDRVDGAWCEVDGLQGGLGRVNSQIRGRQILQLASKGAASRTLGGHDVDGASSNVRGHGLAEQACVCGKRRLRVSDYSAPPNF